MDRIITVNDTDFTCRLTSNGWQVLQIKAYRELSANQALLLWARLADKLGKEIAHSNREKS